MSDKDIEYHYKRMCCGKITQDLFYDMVRDVPNDHLLKIIKKFERQKTAEVIGIVIVTTFCTLFGICMFVYFSTRRG